MDQIRHTMMQHDASFKEQVRALHRLYNIQKSAMLEINKTCPQAQVLAFNSRGTTIVDDQFGGCDLEGRDWRSLCVSGQACKEASAAVSLHPICVLKEFKGSHSLYRDDIGLVAFHTQGKPIRNFDLEKLPEGGDESQIQIEPNNSGTLNEESMFCQRTVMTDDQVSVIKAKLLTTEADPHSSKQIPGINCTMSLPSEGRNQKFDLLSGAKMFVACSSNSFTKENTSKVFGSSFFATVGSLDTFQGLSHSTQWHMENPTLLHQHFQHIQGESNGIAFTGSAGLHPDLRSESTRMTSFQQSEGKLNGCFEVDCLPKKPVVCSSPLLRSLQCEPKDHNNLFIQRSLSKEPNSVLEKHAPRSSASISESKMNSSNDKLEDLSNGRQDMKNSEDKSTSVHSDDNSGSGGSCCKGSQTSHDRSESDESELQDLTHVIQDGFKMVPDLLFQPFQTLKSIKQENLRS